MRERGFIANTATGALVAADGTIDWYCPGRFDRPALFFRLLDPAGALVRVSPAGAPVGGPAQGVQEYVGQSNVLRTVIGDVEVVDFMPWDGTGAGPPVDRIVRVVTARRECEVAVDVVPGSAFGPARSVDAFSAGVAFDGAVVRTGFPMDGLRGAVRMAAGERFVLTVDVAGDRGSGESGGSGEALSVDAALDLAERTAGAWERHAAQSTYDGPYRKAVARSLLALKGLTYFDSGAVVAALTTSLPEDVGGERNWDYRYAWVRDASLAADAVYDAGLEEEAEHFFTWLSRVLADAVFPLRPLYDVTGGWVEGAEQHVPLAGWARSQPVRVGNAAADHRQMDFYADVAGVIHAKQFRRTGSGVHHVWDSMVRMADWLCDAWAEPDRGIWEVRSEPRHFISSKLSCAYALRRLADLAVARDPLDLRAPVWREEAGSILAWVADHGLAADGGLRQDDRTDDDADASLLVPVWRGLWPAGSPVAVRTVDRVLRELGDGPFVYRYRPGPHDGLPGREGAFLPCAFWAVKALAHLGRWDEAHERMEGLVSFGGPLGLLPEEADPRTRAFLGNLPQAYSHLALVEAALALEAGPT